MPDTEPQSESEQRPKQTSIESYGLGQSGYTAGRREGDPSLEQQIEDRNLSYDDEPVVDLETDERFVGRGGRHWSPDRHRT